jgi:hypothetical protein
VLIPAGYTDSLSHNIIKTQYTTRIITEQRIHPTHRGEPLRFRICNVVIYEIGYTFEL